MREVPSPDRPAVPGGTARPPLRGLVVDWGGVLTASLDEAMAVWARSDGVDYEHFRDVMRTWVGRRTPDGVVLDEGTDGGMDGGVVADLEHAEEAAPAGTSPVHLLERGEVPVERFERELAAALAERGSPVEARGLLRRLLGGLEQLDPEMVGIVRRAHDGGLRTVLLSNSWGDHYPEELWNGLFDAVVISGRVGMRKPEERIFRHACDLVGLSPAECVMVDDLPHNVRGAVAAGMVGVLHRSAAQTLVELEALFDRPLGPGQS